MDAASRFRLVQFACFAVLSCGTFAWGQEANPGNASCQEPTGFHPPASNPIRSVVQWLDGWMMRGTPVLLRVAGYLQTNCETKPSVAPWGTKTHPGGKVAEREEKGSEGPPCDAIRRRESIAPADSEPIIEMPVAPPLPTNYHFTFLPSPLTSIAVSFVLAPALAEAA
jgi:hypothetical protein